MTQRYDLTGQTFGYLTALRAGRPTAGGKTTWMCRCRCGAERTVLTADLVRGHSKSCGCLSRAITATRNRTHGHPRDATYWTWANMLRRVKSDRPKWRAVYKDRGITVCERWRSFEAFLADMGERPPGLSLDRINNDLGYRPGNCRWATVKQQARNKQQTRWITYMGQRLCLADWAKKLGVPYLTLFMRLRAGWSLQRAFTVPVRAHRRQLRDPGVNPQ